MAPSQVWQIWLQGEQRPDSEKVPLGQVATQAPEDSNIGGEQEVQELPDWPVQVLQDNEHGRQEVRVEYWSEEQWGTHWVESSK